MAATATVYIYISDLLDSQYFNYSDYHEWYNIVKNIRVFSKNAFTVAKTEMFEYNFDNLGGWAGDLQTLMVDTHIKVQGSTDYTTFYNTLYNSIGQDSFSMKDLYADIDAYNIYILLHEDPDVSLTETLLYYYDDGYKERYSTFTNGWDKYRISKLTYTYTKNKFMSVLHWPLFERDGISYNFTDSQSEAARDAFVQFLMERIENE